MNHIRNIQKFKNRYYIIRHGKSEGNTSKIIISNHINAIDGCPLTEEGKKQVKSSISQTTFPLGQNTIIYSSNYLRAKQTTEIIQKHLGNKEAHYTKMLWDRDFGNFEGKSEQNHFVIWECDKSDPDNKKFNNESANEVMERVTKLIDELEKKYQDKNILLVAHGDTLQILCMAFQKKSASEHRSIKAIKNAEIRKLN